MLTIQHTNNTHTVEQQWEFYSALTLIIDIQGRPTVCSTRQAQHGQTQRWSGARRDMKSCRGDLRNHHPRHRGGNGDGDS